MDDTNDVIHRVNTDGSNVETIASNQTNCAGIQLDLEAGKVYWTSVADDEIRRANLDGTAVETWVSSLGNTFRLDNVEASGDYNADAVPDKCEVADKVY